MRKYLVSVPIIARAEVTVYAENEAQAKEKAYSMSGVQYINRDIMEVADFDAEEGEELFGELDKFLEGYYVFDYEEEFGLTD